MSSKIQKEKKYLPRHLINLAKASISRLKRTFSGIIDNLLTTLSSVITKIGSVFIVYDNSRDIADWNEDIPSICRGHTQVTGMLGGFSITVVVLLTTLSMQGIFSANESAIRAVEISTSLFIMAFFGYVATGILYSISLERKGTHRYGIFGSASLLYYFSGVVTFTAIYPLLRLIQSDTLIVATRIMIAGGFVGAYLAAAIPIYDLLQVKARAIIILFPTSLIIGSAGLLWLYINGFTSEDILPWVTGISAIVITASFNAVVISFFKSGKNLNLVVARLLVAQMIFTTLVLCLIVSLGTNLVWF